MTVDELAKLIGAEVVGDGKAEITSAGTLEDAQSGQVSFLANARYAKKVETTRAGAVIVGAKFEPVNAIALRRTIAERLISTGHYVV